VVYSLLETTVGLVDLWMVRSYGPTATAAIGLSRQVTFLVEAAAIAIATGVITLVSQGIGARQTGQLDDRVDSVVRQSVYLVLIIGIPMTVVGFLISRPLLVGMNADSETLSHGASYLQVYFLGIVFLWFNVVLTSVFRGCGDVTTPLKLALGTNVFNVVLNYVFIYGAGPLPAFEVQGAAMGTVGARAVAAVVYLTLLLRGTAHARLKLRCGGFDIQMIGQVLRIGVPMALASLLRNGSRLVFLSIVGASALGVPLHAATAVGLQVRMLSILPAVGFQAATAALVGQAVGRRKYDEAEALGHRSFHLLAALMIVVVPMIVVLARPIATLFLASGESIDLGTQVLRWFAVAQLFSALSIGTQGALIGAGDTTPVMRYMLVTQWFVMLPLACALLIFGWVPGGLLFAWTVAPLLSLALTQRRWRSGRWRGQGTVISKQ
jgi:putative MATE family efflux protein